MICGFVGGRRRRWIGGLEDKCAKVKITSADSYKILFKVIKLTRGVGFMEGFGATVGLLVGGDVGGLVGCSETKASVCKLLGYSLSQTLSIQNETYQRNRLSCGLTGSGQICGLVSRRGCRYISGLERDK